MMRLLAVLALFVLTACGAENIWADDSAVLQARYVAEPPTSVTLFTVISERNGSGAHSGLLVNGSEQVLFDPAGSMELKSMPERNDVLFGATPRMVKAYIDYHVRDTYRMTEQTRLVSPEVAEMILARVKANGAVPKAHCANAISRILVDIPGFENISTTYFPKQLSKSFGSYPNVSMRLITDATVDTSQGITFLEPEEYAARTAAAQGQ